MAPIPVTLAHSPDSDDMVMWWPLIGLDGQQPAIDVGPFRFELVARDVEELNRLVVGERADGDGSRVQPSARPYDVTAISCAAFPAIQDRYAITRCGGSFGEGYGPRVVARSTESGRAGERRADGGSARPVRSVDGLRGACIAVPGVHTTAFMALTLLLGGTKQRPAFEPVEMLFSEIPDAVADGRVDAGLLIHEAQLTFEALGLVEIVNLGRWWAAQTDLPLPLGLNVVRRDLDRRIGTGTVAQLGRVLHQSVGYAIDHPAECRAYLQQNKGNRAEWDDPQLVDRYLAMYVNDMTRDMGKRGVQAIAFLLEHGHRAGLCDAPGPIEPV